MKRIRFTILFLALFFIADYFLSVAHFSTIIHKYDVDTNSFEDVFVSDSDFFNLECLGKNPFDSNDSFNSFPSSTYSETCAACPVIGNGTCRFSIFFDNETSKRTLAVFKNKLLKQKSAFVLSDKILLYAPKKSPPIKTA